MNTYAAFLRGINVGGKHRVNMTELVKALEEAGLFNVRTYIQSGNVVFEAAEAGQTLKLQMEQAMATRFGFPIPVVLRSAKELRAIIENCPYTREEIRAAGEISGVESLHICLLEGPPSPEAAEKLQAASTGGDRFEIRDKNVYLLLANGVHRSKLAQKLAALSPSATMRNWKTMVHLAQMTEERAD